MVSLGQAKLYLRVEHSEEDSLIQSMLQTAQDIVEGVLSFPLSEMSEPAEPVNHTILYITSQLYESRESLDMAETLRVVKSLLFALRKESW